MNSGFRFFTTTTRRKKVLIIAGAALVLLIGIIAVTTIAMRDERKTCEEWMAHAFSEPGFESNIGPACLWGGTDPDKAYTLEELEDISREMEESGEGGDLGDVMPEDESTEDDEAGDIKGTNPEEPLPAGSTVEVGNWTVSILEVKLDATDEILAESEGYEPPGEGFQIAMITVEGTYNGTEIGTLADDVIVGIWAEGAYYEDCPYSVPNELLYEPDVSTGGSISGNVCAEIPSETTDILTYVSDWETDLRYHLEMGL